MGAPYGSDLEADQTSCSATGFAGESHIAHMIALQIPTIHKFGYSCQTILARCVNDSLHGGSYWCWFSEEFNPDDGGNSSNPCWRYQTFDKAVKKKDFSDAYLRDAREKLIDALNLAVTLDYNLLKPGNNEATIRMAKDILTIRHAGIEFYRPQIWRIDLSKTAGRYSSGHQYWHEHLLKDLKCEEFETIIE